MKDAVIIKSYQNGITLLLDADSSFEQILEEICFKFTQGKNFFGTSSVALSIEGRVVSETEEIQILEAIKQNSGVNVVCVVGKNEETNKGFIKALQHAQQRMTNGDEGQFFKGSLKNGEVLETESNIVILGDVYPGCAVISTKNIIILGGLYGEAYAGGSGQDDAYVVALEMEPERVKIGDFKYKANAKQTKWGIRSKVQPKIAYVKNERIVFEPLTKDLLSSF